MEGAGSWWRSGAKINRWRGTPWREPGNPPVFGGAGRDMGVVTTRDIGLHRATGWQRGDCRAILEEPE